MSSRIPARISHWVLALLAWPCMLPAADLNAVFANPQFTDMKISPDGRLVAVQRVDGEHVQIEVIDFDNRRGLPGIHTADYPQASIGQMAWADADSLIVQLETEDVTSELIALNWRDDPQNGPRLEALRVVEDAWLIDPLVGEDNLVMFGRRNIGGLRLPRNLGGLSRVTWDISKAFKVNIDLVNRKDRLVAEEIAQHSGRVMRWLLDKQGELRALTTWTDGDGTSSYYRNDETGKWFKYWGLEEQIQEYRTVGVIGDKWVYIIGRSNRNTDALYKWQVETDELIEVYANDDFDVHEGIFNEITRELVGLTYYEDGVKRFVYLDDEWRAAQEFLEKTHGDKIISVISRAYDAQRFLYVAYNALRPGGYFLYDAASGAITKLGDILPGYDHTNSAPTETGHFFTDDNLKVTYFITLPANAGGSLPLIVMPHGGPFGIQDVLSFQPTVQYFAQHGFAVLRINYRGSSGTGEEFLSAGEKQWGRGIEDDIDAAVDTVLENYPLDPERIAVVGASYGGYSALMNIIRRPDRYRCAVSFAGATDLPLLFTSSDWTMSADVIDIAKNIIGDPETEYEDMLSRSPVTLADRIERPVFLIQGDSDERVDMEHYWRMLRALNEHGKQAETLLLEGVGHGLVTPEQRTTVYGKVVDFVRNRCT